MSLIAALLSRALTLPFCLCPPCTQSRAASARAALILADRFSSNVEAEDLDVLFRCWDASRSSDGFFDMGSPCAMASLVMLTILLLGAIVPQGMVA